VRQEDLANDRMNLVPDVESYLRLRGWESSAPGRGGALWSKTAVGGLADGSTVIAVPDVIRFGTTEWRSVLQRLAAYEHREPFAVQDDLLHQLRDTFWFSASSDLDIYDTIALDAGVDLLTSVKAMLRCTATTAQSPRSQIGGAYSRVGDRIADRARLGHSRSGSYMIPIMMELDPPPPRDDFELHDATAERVAYEPAERRVMRTLAQALVAVESRVLQPEREPTREDVVPLVAAGVSREFVVAVERSVSDSRVGEIASSFDWALAVAPPGGTPKGVAIPSEAAGRLEKVASYLRTARRDASQIISGLIVEVRHVPDDPLAEIALQVVRNGRLREVRVRIRSDDQLADCHEWMQMRRTVVVEGTITRSPGQPLRVDKPAGLYPLDETFLVRTD
jgi:hypothetical protein